MYTSDDVFNIIDKLPEIERWEVLEYALKTIKADVAKKIDPEIGDSPRWFVEAAGAWSDLDEDTWKKIDIDLNKIDRDGWNLSL